MAEKKKTKTSGKAVVKKAAARTVKKAPAKKVAAKKTPAKKAPARKVVAKKAAAKKAAAKKAPAKKAVAAKTPARKPAAKSAAKKPAKAVAVKTVAKPAAKAAKPAPAKQKASTGKAKGGLTSRERERLRKVLIEMRERLTGQVSALKSESLTRSDEVNVEEDGTDAFDRQFALTLASSENDAVFEIDEALHRMEAGEFGNCEECGGKVEMARLRAIPFVRNCIGCQSELEKRRPGYRPPARFH